MVSEFFIEELEQRVAPANASGLTINVGSAGSENYTTSGTHFVLTSASPQTDIATLFAGSTDQYYLALNAGDVVNYATTGGQTNFLTITAGKAIAFFNDFNHDGIVQSNELTGLAVSAGSSTSVGFSVHGDILTAVNGTTGVFSTSLISDTQNIAKLNVNGDVDGSILAGGSIANVAVGSVNLIGSGTVGNGHAIDLGGGTGPGQGTLGNITLAAKKAGPNISSVTLTKLGSIATNGGIIASDAGAGGIGGSVTGVTIQQDTDGFLVKAGAGGAVNGSGTAGAGGKVSSIVAWGVEDATSDDLISIQGGAGGVGTGGAGGGAGGAIDNIYIGYQAGVGKSSSYVKSAFYLGDRVEVLAGDGGSGLKTGGIGGALSSINVRVAAPGQLGDGIHLEAGDGGASTDATGGKSGNGGAVSSYYLLNNNIATTPVLSKVSVIAGDGGGGGATGGTGGAITSGVILSQALSIDAGDGGAGTKTGGIGGAITTLQVAFRDDAALVQFGQQESNLQDVVAQDVALRAGKGGDGTTAAATGGNGGSISGVTAPKSDLLGLTINASNGADGGLGGGNGGSVTNVKFDSDLNTLNEVNAVLRAGDGAAGAKKGGIGGSFITSSFILTDANITATTGNGGASSAGSGGNGGNVQTLNLVVLGTVSGANGFVSLTTGNGGDAQTSGTGGNGGTLTNATTVARGNVTVTTGNGGATDTGTSGSGGLVSGILVSAGNSGFEFTKTITTSYDSTTPLVAPSTTTVDSAGPVDGNATLITGNAGGDLNMGTAAKGGGNGGSITKAVVQGINNITVTSGSGALGGSGGDIVTSSATGSASEVTLITVYDDVSANTNTYVGFKSTGVFGNIAVTAGNGSDGVKNAGKGGSLLTFTGATSYLVGGTTTFTAGNGGISQTGTGGAGGSVSGLTVNSGTENFSVIAGDGGNSLGKSAGGTGGNVQNVSIDKAATLYLTTDISSKSVDTLVPTVLNIAAGNAGSTALGTKGTVGGSVTNVNAKGDIGIRYGQNFGFNSMGGIFAGLGGASAGTAGANGNVTSVTANFIASIVAGRAATPGLVGLVDGINLAGKTYLTPNTDGGFNYFDSFNSKTGSFVGGIEGANFVGGFSDADPSQANTDQYKAVGHTFTAPVETWLPGYVPLDGLVAALVLGKNNTPINAWLTVNGGNTVLVSAFN